MTTPGLFITGTNTGVGKTAVACHIASRLRDTGTRVGVYKPACSGAERDDAGCIFFSDVRQLSAAVDDSFSQDWICPQRFTAALAPPSAARLEGKRVDPELLRAGAARWNGNVDLLLVEGVGGLLCPLTEDETVADLAVDLGYPLLIVSSLELGTINHTLMTLEVARARRLPVAGIVMNSVIENTDPDVENASLSEIAARTDVTILGPILHQPRGRNGDCLDSAIDWKSFIEQSIVGKMSTV